jgi:hypothetical protein
MKRLLHIRTVVVVEMVVAFLLLLLALVLLLVTLCTLWDRDRDLVLRASGVVVGLGGSVALAYFAWAQLRHASLMGMLDTMPVLTPWLPRDDRLMVGNCGHGPAMDVRVYALRPGDGDEAKPERVFEARVQGGKSHVGPHEEPLRANPQPHRQPGQDIRARQSDVWVVHCGDLNGEHWHAWCNRTRLPDSRYKQGEPWIFETERMTPAWIRRYCPRCAEIRKLREGKETRE